MKFGKMKYDVPFEKIDSGHLNFTFWEKFQIVNEGKRIYRENPQYTYLNEDQKLKDEKQFYESVVYAYMIDQILQEDLSIAESYKKFSKGRFWTKTEKGTTTNYRDLNYYFLLWYRDYLREQADPGCLAREQAQKDKELQESIELHCQIDAYYAAKHPRVECPYCHSMNTEKISGVARGVSIYALGVASPKLGKQWHCNNCKSDF